MPAIAQDVQPGDVRKMPSATAGVGLTAAQLGLPADVDAVKLAVLAVTKLADATAHVEDNDKIAGNPMVAPPLSERVKLPSALPDPAQTAADPGTGTDAPKTTDVAVTRTADGRTTRYDTDKIEGNPEVIAPLTERQKAPGIRPAGAADADLGVPADGAAPKVAGVSLSKLADMRPTIYDEDKIDGNEPPPPPLDDRAKAASVLEFPVAEADLGVPVAGGDTLKTADLAGSHAQAVPSIYDEDKIAGNDPAPDPLGERQKAASVLPGGVDFSAFGQPATEATKLADLGVGKAADSMPSVEDNDKIAGNPYIAPPLPTRQKLAAVLPDPVVDPDMGQPAIEAPKTTDLAVSKQADGIPGVDDNDKIVGNAVVSPPLPDRIKVAATAMPPVGTTPDALGLPADGTAVKTAESVSSKSADAVESVHDEDKIAGNDAVDPFGSVDDFRDMIDPGPPAELLAQIRSMLDDPAMRDTVLDAARARVQTPDAVTDAFASFLAALFDQPTVRDRLADEIAKVFVDFAFAPDNPQTLGRMAAEQLTAWPGEDVQMGMSRLPLAEKRAYLTDALRIAEALSVAQCAPFLDGAMAAAALRQTELAALSTWTATEVQANLIRTAAAIVAELQDRPAFVELPRADYDRAQQLAGEKLVAAIDGMEQATALYAAYGDPATADPADLCAVHLTILRTVLDTGGAEGDLLVRYIVDYGWVN